MNKKNIIVITIVAILAISLLVVGAFLFEKKKTTSVTVEPKKEFASVEGEEGMVWYPVPELGIEIKVNKDIAPELVYKAQSVEGDWWNSAVFSTQKLIKMAEKNGFSPDSQEPFGCRIGTFSSIVMGRDDQKILDHYQGRIKDDNLNNLPQVGGYYIDYNSPQFACSYGANGYDASDQKYEDFINTNWWKKEGTDMKELLQKAVRRLQ